MFGVRLRSNNLVSLPTDGTLYMLSGGGLPPRFFKTQTERDVAWQEEISDEMRHAELQIHRNQLGIVDELAERERMLEVMDDP